MLQVIEDNVILNQTINSFVINGDPGCDGYNTEAVIILEESLKLDTDFVVIVGDMVPVGREKYFKPFVKMVNSVATSPVYCLPGNHDLPDYEQFCGQRDYFILADNALMIMLDNSRRYFSDETLVFLRSTLNDHPHDNIFIFFHIPLPNTVVPNHVTDDQWQRLKQQLEPYKSDIQGLFCGHVHSAFEYNLDGFRVIVSGGGGSELDEVYNSFAGRNVNHVMKVEFDRQNWHLQMIPLEMHAVRYEELSEPTLQQIVKDLHEGVAGEALAYRKYLIYSDIAMLEGWPGVATVFKAAAESEYYHSRNMYLASGEHKTTVDNIKRAMTREADEFERLYPEFMQHAGQLLSKRVANAYDCALQTEKIHYRLLNEALQALESGSDLEKKVIYTCRRCGFTHDGEPAPTRCPACGADRFKFSQVSC